jgi:UDP-glucuronate 4-epimerase
MCANVQQNSGGSMGSDGLTLVTGAAGFIGYHVTQALISRGSLVLGIDTLNDYYDVSLKEARLGRLSTQRGFSFERVDVADRDKMQKLFKTFDVHRVVHLAAQAGVRYSVQNPHAYADTNLGGFLNVLEGCRHAGVEHLVFASSSSVYGGNAKMPLSEHDGADHPLSLYAATKKANEAMAHSYAHLYKLPCTGLRFFTVYGPWGRPDMALFSFTRSILEGKPIDVYNNGKMKRDFTYVDDITAGVVRALDRIAQPDPNFNANNPDPASSFAPYRIYNIGNSEPVELLRFIEVLEKALGKSAKKNLLPMQAGDVPETFAEVSDLTRDVGFKPNTPIEAGVKKFVEWYKEYYRV